MVRIGRPDNGNCRLQKIRNRRSFSHEFRVYANAEIFSDFLATGFLKGGHYDRFCCTGQNGATQNYKVKTALLPKGFTDFLANRTDVAEIQLPVPHTGSTDAKERNVSLQNGFLRIGGRAKAAALVAFSDKFRYSRLHDRTPP